MTQTTLNPVRVEQLASEGYCITDVLFDDASIAGVKAEFERLWQESIASCETKGNAKDIDLMHTRPFLAYLDKHSAICRAFCLHPIFADICRQLIGPDVDMSWNQAIIKPPAVGKAFGWHQDAHYAVSGPHAKDTPVKDLTNPANARTFWVAITRTIVDNGTLWVVPGMHKQGILPHKRDDADTEWQMQFDNSWKIPAVMKSGQMLVFTNCTPHGSGPNISNEIRMAYQIGFTIPGLVNSASPLPLLRNGKHVG